MSALAIAPVHADGRRLSKREAQASAVQPVITLSDVDRPAGLAMLLWAGGGGGRAYMCDTAAHVIDVIDEVARPLFSFGGFGDRPGQLNEPCDILVVPTDPWLNALTMELALVVVADRGNHRVQLFEPDGVLFAVLSSDEPGRRFNSRSSAVHLDVEVAGLVHPSHLEWRGSWLDITTYGQRLIRIDIGHALKSAANDLDRRTARTTSGRALTEYAISRPGPAHAGLRLAIAEGQC